MQATNHLPIGSLLQGAHTYKIEQVLGQGSFGITYLASTRIKVDGALGALEVKTTVAIKEFFMRDINERAGAQVSCGSKDGIYAHYRHKFAREAENLSKLNHPHIVRVLEAFEANNTVYYAMEFCEGGSLDELIGRDGLSEGQALDFARQIGSALDYMHRARILHLDLKPGNVMLREDGTVSLIDFGLSKQYDESGEPESSTTIGGGTPGYAPLEQSNYREGKEFPVQMDVYALGATLYKMLTGERPAEAAVLLNEGFPANRLAAKGVSEPTIAVVEKAMSPMKRDRYGSMAEFLTALDSYTEGSVEPNTEEKTVIEVSTTEETVVDQPAEAPKPAPAPKPASAPAPASKTATTSTPPKKKGSKKGLWIALIAVMGCILIGGAVYLWEPWIERFDHEEFRGTGALNGYDYVDLGLSVKWATCNVGASSPSEYGNYYAWGETTPKSEYTEENCKTYGKDLGNIAGDPNYDAARANWGGSWRLPTQAEVQELIDQCTWVWGYYQGKKGYKITGPNGFSIFLPAAGWQNEAQIELTGKHGYYNSSTPAIHTGAYDSGTDLGPYYAFCLDLADWAFGAGSGFLRYFGYSVRPVIANITTESTPATQQFYDADGVPIEEPLATEEIATEKAKQERLAAERAAKEKAEQERLAAEKAEQERLAAEKAAKEKAEKERREREAREAAEKAERERLAREEAARQAAAQATRGTINGHEWVDLGLSVKWATCNVGASSPSDYGNYYAWGETRTKSEYYTSNSATFNKSMGDIAGSSYDAARANWGSSWRLPTKAEFQELIDKCTWTWTSQGGHNGYKVTGKTGNSIFLPAAGRRDGSSLHGAGEDSNYWSSAPRESGSKYASDLDFCSGDRGVGWGTRSLGFAVRPVSE